MIARSRRIVIYAGGSAYYGALAVRNTLEELSDIGISVELASDFPERQPPKFRDDCCCFVDFSGDEGGCRTGIAERGGLCPLLTVSSQGQVWDG